MTNRIGKLRRTSLVLEQVHLNFVGSVNGGGGRGQPGTVKIHDGVGNRFIIYSLLGVFSDIKGQHNTAFFGIITVLPDQIPGVTLGRCLNGPGVDPVGTDTDQSPAAAGAERDDLIKGIQQKIPFFRLD